MAIVAPENLLLVKFVLILIFFIHLPFVGVMIGGSAVSMLFEIYGRLERRPHYRRFADQLLARTTHNKGLALLIALAVALNLLFLQAAYPPAGLSPRFALAVLLPLTAGLAGIYLYRYLLPTRLAAPLAFPLGLASVGAMLLAYFVLLCGAALLLRPDEWPHLSGQPWLLLSWNGAAKFLQFFALSLAVSGAGILLHGANLCRRPKVDADFCRFVKRSGATLALAAVLAWPLILLFDLYTLPVFARSGYLYILSAVALVIGLATAGLLLTSLENPRAKLAAPVIVCCLTLFLGWILSDHLAREQTLNEQTIAAKELMRSAFIAKQPAETPAAAIEGDKTPAVDQGKTVFERVCSACHHFDRRVVGPALQEVLPGYAGNLEGLKAFIRDPQKRNPDYPPMPKLGLAEEEIDAVARYLLRTIGD